MTTTTIEWTEHVWNPTTGCDRVSAGCDHCYALTLAKRLKGMGSAKYQNDGDPRTSGPGFGVTEHPDVLDEPLHWRKPRLVFVNSMSDLFHPQVSDWFIGQVFERMGAAPRHTFQILTKRAPRMRALLRRWERCATEGCRCPDDARGCLAPVDLFHGTWPLPNVWGGVSVENQAEADRRIPLLLDTPLAVRWLSCEPLLGPVDLDPYLPGQGDPAHGFPNRPGVGWVVAGGESGPGARPAHPAWFRQLRDQCAAVEVPFHFKQVGAWTWRNPDWPPHDWATHPDRNAVVYLDGGVEQVQHAKWTSRDAVCVYRVGKKAAGRELDGQLHDAMPERAR